MAKDKSSDFFKTTLAPESLAFRLLGTAHAVARVEEGQSLPSALASVFSHPKMDAATRGAIQDIAYLTERKLGLCEFLIEQLTRQPPSPPLLKTLLASSLALLVGENDIASVLGTGFAHARLVDLDAAVFDGPCRGHVGTVVAAPSVERFAVEDGNEAFFYIGSLGCGRAVGRGFLIRIRYAGSCHCGNGHATDSTH